MIISSPEALPDIDPAAIWLRPPFGPSKIGRRRGPLKLLSKLRSEPKKLRGLNTQDLTRPAPLVRRIIIIISIIIIIILIIIIVVSVAMVIGL